MAVWGRGEAFWLLIPLRITEKPCHCLTQQTPGIWDARANATSSDKPAVRTHLENCSVISKFGVRSRILVLPKGQTLTVHFGSCHLTYPRECYYKYHFYATWALSYRRRKLREAGSWTTLPWYWERTWLMWSPLSQQQTLKEWSPPRDSSPVVVDITLKQQPLEVYYVLYEGYKDLIKVQARPSYILYTALESITGQHSLP